MPSWHPHAVFSILLSLGPEIPPQKDMEPLHFIANVGFPPVAAHVSDALMKCQRY